MRLKGKVTVITGAGCGYGMSRGFPTAFAREGADLVLNHFQQDPQKMQEIKEELEGYGAKVVLVEGDISQEDTAHKLIQSAMDSFGRVDVLINVAGISNPKLLIDITTEDWNRMLAVDLDLTSVRLGDVFGPWERPTGVRNLMSAPYQTLKMAIQGQTAVLPRPNRTNWVYSRDVARAICHVAEKRHLHQNVLNIGGPEVWSIEEWCQALQKRFTEFHYVIDPTDANVRYHALQDNAVLDITALRSDGEFCPAFGLEEALADYCTWAGRFGYLMT